MRDRYTRQKFAQKVAVDMDFAKSVNVFANQALVVKIAQLPRGKCTLEKATAMAMVNASTASASVTLAGQEKLVTSYTVPCRLQCTRKLLPWSLFLQFWLDG